MAPPYYGTAWYDEKRERMEKFQKETIKTWDKKPPVHGEIIEVVDPGQTYPTYRNKVEELGATNWRHNVDPMTGEVCVIVEIGIHSNNYSKPVVLIESLRDGWQYLIGLSGVKRATFSHLEDELFEI